MDYESHDRAVIADLTEELHKQCDLIEYLKKEFNSRAKYSTDRDADWFIEQYYKRESND